MATILEDFESGSFSNEWQVNNSNFDYNGYNSTAIYEGSGSAGPSSSVNNNTNPIATYIPNEFSGGAKPDKLSWYWHETQSSFGGGIRVKDSNGDVIGGMLTDNPEWYIQTGINSFTQVGSTSAPYEVWVKVEMQFDYANDEITYVIDETTSSTNSTTNTKASVSTLDDVEKIEVMGFNNFNGDGYTSGSFEMGFDLFEATGLSTSSPTVYKGSVKTTSTNTPIYKGSVKTTSTNTPIYKGSVKQVTTDGLQYNIDTDVRINEADLLLNVNDIVNTQGAVAKFKVDGSTVGTRTVSSTGTYSVTATGLASGTQFNYTVEIERDNNLISSKSETFTTLAEADTNIEYESSIEVTGDINTTPIVENLYNSTTAEITEYALLDGSGNVLFSSSDPSQLSSSRINNNRVEFEAVTYEPQTNTSDTVSDIEFNTTNTNIITEPVNTDGGKRILVIVPIEAQ